MQFEQITPELIRCVIENHVRKTEPHFRLPKVSDYQGCIAGGAVANTILYLTRQVDKLIINDVDIFVYPTYHTNVAATLNIKLDDHDLKKEMKISGYRGQNSTSHIVGTARIGALNIIFSEIHMAGMLLKGFDINCCQAAIPIIRWGPNRGKCVSNANIETTPEFKTYLKTRQLEATFAHSPFNTACRMLNKHRDLGGYLNIDMELRILSQLYHQRKIAGDTELKDFPIPEKYYGYFDKYPVLHKYFVEHPDNTYRTIDQSIGLGTWASIYHYRVALGTQGGFAKRLLNEAAKCLTIEDHQADVLTQVLTNTKPEQGVPTHQALKACWSLYGHTHASSILKVTWNVHNDYKVAKAIKAADDEYPGIHGVIEGNWRVREVITNKGPIKAIGVAIDEYKKQNIVLNKAIDVPNTFGNVGVKELISTHCLRIEGRDMKHCVGGYSSQIENGFSKIFSLTHLTTGERSTFQVRWSSVDTVTQEEPVTYNWFIGQNRGKCNASPGEDLRAAGNLIAVYMQEHISGPKGEKPATRPDIAVIEQLLAAIRPDAVVDDEILF